MTTISIADEVRLQLLDEGAGEPVVLLHGFPFSATMWDPQRVALRSEYRVILPSLRGFGGSDHFTDAPSIDQMADDVAVLLDALSISQPVVLGGLSMGGYVALAFARRHANRLRGLILADTRAEADTDEARSNRNQLIEYIRSRSARDVVEVMLQKLVGAGTRERQPEILDRIRELVPPDDPRGAIAALIALRDRPDATPGLASITVPTLVIVGSDDAITPPASADLLASRIPGASKVMIAGAGHLSNLEQPELFNSALQAFLQNLP